MKLSRWSMVALLAVLLPLVASAAETEKIFQSDKLKYSFRYSSDYQLKTAGDITYLVSPHKDKKSGFAPNVNVAVKYVGRQALKDVYEKGKGDLAVSLGDAKIIEDTKDRVAGLDAYKLVYTSQQNKVGFKLAQVMFKSADGFIYVITYTTLTELFDLEVGMFQAVLKSFKITG